MRVYAQLLVCQSSFHVQRAAPVTPLPHNLEAEQALLGALLFDNKTLERIPALRAEHFYDPVHGRLFALIASEIAARRLADGVRLKEVLGRDGGLAEIGGAAYLMKLMAAAAPLSHQAVSYAELIRDLALRRDVATAARTAYEFALATPEGADGSTALAEAERLLREVETTGEGGMTLRAAARLAVTNVSRGSRGIKTGIKAIDDQIGGLFAPDVIVLAGRPSMGKTSLAANIAHSVALRDYGVHFASLEMDAEQIAQRALSRASYDREQRFEYRAFRRGGVVVDLASALAERMPENLIIDSTAAQTLAHLTAALRATRRRLGRLDVVVIDYLQLMRDEAGRRGETAEVTAITKGVKQIAKDFRVAIILLSQLSREVEKRQDKRPQLSDLRQSGSIEQDADIVMFAFRENYYLTRSEPVPHDGESRVDFDVRYHQWADRCEETSGRMEVIAAKTRMDEAGSSFIMVDLGYDVAADLPADKPPTYHTTKRGAA